MVIHIDWKKLQRMQDKIDDQIRRKKSRIKVAYRDGNVCPICKKRLRAKGENVCTICFTSTDLAVILKRCHLKVKSMHCPRFVDTDCYVYGDDPAIDNYPTINIDDELVRMNRVVAMIYGLKEPGTKAEGTGLEGLKIARTGKSFDLNSSYHVLHNCNVKRCINHDHLIVGTHSQNILQAYRDGPLSHIGEKNPNTKLTDEQVKILKDLPIKEIMVLTGLSHSQATKIKYERSWGHISPSNPSDVQKRDPRYKITDDDLSGYRKRLKDGGNFNSLVQEMIDRYGLHKKNVKKLLLGKQRPERRK